MLSSPAPTKLPKTHFLRCPKPDPEALSGPSGTAGLYIGAATFHIYFDGQNDFCEINARVHLFHMEMDNKAEEREVCCSST